MFPKLSAGSQEEQQALLERAMMTFAGLLGVPLVGAIFLTGPFLHLWVHERLGPEAPLIGRIMIAAMWANGLALISFTKLEASGRPDLVARILLIEIPPYLLLLYLGIHFMGLVGSAIATAIRYVGDFLLLTAVAGPPRRGRWILTVNFLVLVLAVWLSSLWAISDWRWWGAAGVLCLVMLALGARTLPPDIKAQIGTRTRVLWKRA
jgi:O-antigen/teichoic acid export membrane protein